MQDSFLVLAGNKHIKHETVKNHNNSQASEVHRLFQYLAQVHI